MRLQRIMLTITAIFALFFSVVTANAEGNSGTSVEVSLPVSCTEKADVFIDAMTENAPMPASQRLSITEKNPGEYKMVFKEPGIYTYKVTQIKTDSRIVYDKREYEVFVYIFFTDDEIMRSIVVATDNLQKEKPDRVYFRNRPVEDGYENCPDCSPSPSPTPGNSEKRWSSANTADNWDYKPYTAILIMSLAIVTYSALKLKNDRRG